MQRRHLLTRCLPPSAAPPTATDRPADGNPPPAGIAAQQLDHVGGSAAAPRPVEPDYLVIFH